MSTTLQNVYYERKVGTARPCYVCRRPTQTVLATLKSEDFVYTCDSHLSDPGFATLIAPTGPSADDIRKVIADYSARETRRTALKDEAEKKKDEDKDKKPEEKKGLVGGLISSVSSSISSLAMGDTDEKKDTKPSSPAPASPGSPTTTGIPSVPAQTHKKYALHRTFFENRRAELRRREQTARAKEVSKDMPQVPRGFRLCPQQRKTRSPVKKSIMVASMTRL